MEQEFGEKLNKWMDTTNKRILNNQNSPTFKASNISQDNKENENASLKVIMNKDENNETKVCVEYSIKTHVENSCEYDFSTLKWNMKDLIVENTFYEILEEGVEKETSYTCAFYKNFSGLRSEKFNEKLYRLYVLADGKDINLNICIEKHHIRKLMELLMTY